MGTVSETTPSHEFAEIFPLHEGQPLWELSDSIKANGQRDAIVLLDGKILDGRRRELACLRAGVKPNYRRFGSKQSDGDDPLEFVYDCNFHRRHLGDGDKKICAGRYATAKLGHNQHNGERVCQNDGPSSTRQQAAKKFNVTTSDVDRAKKVTSKGTPSLQAAVSDDTLSVSDAAKVADQPPEVQDAAVQAVKDGKARTAVQAVLQQMEPGEDHHAEETPQEEMDRINSSIESFCRKLKAFMEDCPEDHWLKDLGRREGALRKVKDACETLRSGKCAGLCPKCNAKGCDKCHKTGRLPKMLLDTCK